MIHLSGPMKFTNEHNHSIPWHLPVVYLPHRLLPGIGGFDVGAVLISIFPEGYSQGKKSYHTNLPYLWCLDNPWELIIKNMSAMFIALTLLAEKQTSSSKIHDVCNVYFPGWNQSDCVCIFYIFYIGKYRVSVYLFSIQINAAHSQDSGKSNPAGIKLWPNSYTQSERTSNNRLALTPSNQASCAFCMHWWTQNVSGNYI